MNKLTCSVAIIVVGMLGAGCAPATFSTTTLESDYYCSYMKDVCREAREFEERYATMTAEAKEDAENVLKAYQYQCNQASDACKKSQKSGKKWNR